MQEADEKNKKRDTRLISLYYLCNVFVNFWLFLGFV